MADDIADQVSDQVAEQLNTSVAVQVGTAVAEARAPAIEQGATVRDATPTDQATQVTTALDDEASSFSCNPRKTCSKMTSCAEALFHLNSCQNASLDRNQDGIPCEAICSAADVPGYVDDKAAEPTQVIVAPIVTGQVTRVIDGDTIDVRIDGETARIRYLQVNTPERNEPCYNESTGYNAELVAGKTVTLVPDRELVDRYDRWLRFVYVGDLSVSRALVEQGYAEVVLYPPNDAHYAEFVRLEAEAAAAGRGCHPTGIFDDGSTTR